MEGTHTVNGAASAKKPPSVPNLPPYSWSRVHGGSPARLHYIRTVDAADHHVESLHVECLRNNEPLGFDMEWKPVWKKDQKANPVALVQLANANTILLIQVSNMPWFPKQLQSLLADDGVPKLGVGIQHDSEKLFEDYSISMRNCVDLSLLARCVDNARWKGPYRAPIALARLVESYEQLHLLKTKKLTCANWEAVLAPMHQHYAANDAHCAYVLYYRFMAMAEILLYTLLPVYYSFNSINGTLHEPSGALWIPYNPYYDPGPPPPPREPKENDKGKKGKKKGGHGLSAKQGCRGGQTAVQNGRTADNTATHPREFSAPVQSARGYRDTEMRTQAIHAGMPMMLPSPSPGLAGDNARVKALSTHQSSISSRHPTITQPAYDKPPAHAIAARQAPSRLPSSGGATSGTWNPPAVVSSLGIRIVDGPEPASTRDGVSFVHASSRQPARGPPEPANNSSTWNTQTVARSYGTMVVPEYELQVSMPQDEYPAQAYACQAPRWAPTQAAHNDRTGRSTDEINHIGLAINQKPIDAQDGGTSTVDVSHVRRRHKPRQRKGAKKQTPVVY